jgi:hypothetical protein
VSDGVELLVGGSGHSDRILMSVLWDDLLVHRGDLRGWLVGLQPVDESRGNWWLGVALVATGEVQAAALGGGVPDRVTLAAAVAVINLATEEGMVAPANRAVRLAGLAGLVAAAGGSSDLPSELLPDRAARCCLSLISEDLAGQGDSDVDWRSLPVEEMRELRATKNLLTPVLRLEPYLQDPDLANEVAGWTAVYPRLP